jgi:hypothetical protein
MSRLFAFLRFALVLLFVIARPAFAGDPEWMEVRSPHFSMITDAGESVGGRSRYISSKCAPSSPL